MELHVVMPKERPGQIMQWDVYIVKENDLPIIEKLMQRDFKTAILNRHHDNEGIELLANDIITQRG